MKSLAAKSKEIRAILVGLCTLMASHDAFSMCKHYFIRSDSITVTGSSFVQMIHPNETLTLEVDSVNSSHTGLVPGRKLSARASFLVQLCPVYRDKVADCFPYTTPATPEFPLNGNKQPVGAKLEIPVGQLTKDLGPYVDLFAKIRIVPEIFDRLDLNRLDKDVAKRVPKAMESTLGDRKGLLSLLFLSSLPKELQIPYKGDFFVYRPSEAAGHNGQFEALAEFGLAAYNDEDIRLNVKLVANFDPTTTGRKTSSIGEFPPQIAAVLNSDADPGQSPDPEDLTHLIGLIKAGKVPKDCEVEYRSLSSKTADIELSLKKDDVIVHAWLLHAITDENVQVNDSIRLSEATLYNKDVSVLKALISMPQVVYYTGQDLQKGASLPKYVKISDKPKGAIRAIFDDHKIYAIELSLTDLENNTVDRFFNNQDQSTYVDLGSRSVRCGTF